MSLIAFYKMIISAITLMVLSILRFRSVGFRPVDMYSIPSLEDSLGQRGGRRSVITGHIRCVGGDLLNHLRFPVFKLVLR